MKKIITICAFAACLTGCDDLFEPAIENNLGLEYMYENSQYAEGILANAYTRIRSRTAPLPAGSRWRSLRPKRQRCYPPSQWAGYRRKDEAR